MSRIEAADALLLLHYHHHHHHHHQRSQDASTTNSAEQSFDASATLLQHNNPRPPPLAADSDPLPTAAAKVPLQHSNSILSHPATPPASPLRPTPASAGQNREAPPVPVPERRTNTTTAARLPPIPKTSIYTLILQTPQPTDDDLEGLDITTLEEMAWSRHELVKDAMVPIHAEALHKWRQQNRS